VADDDRFLTIEGRRWRRSDPAIPETLRAELVSELMAARRAVRTDPGARRRVLDAKVALGERGRPWWEPLDDAALRHRAAATIRALLRHRAGRSICPSDAARVAGGQRWRAAMPVVRDVAAELADVGELVCTQRGEPVSLRSARGPVRLAPADERATR
jgi:hypothetical protein